LSLVDTNYLNTICQRRISNRANEHVSRVCVAGLP